MELKELYDKTKEKMTKTINALNSEYDSIRAGRASAKVLDKIQADYYGTPTPINQMASVSNADARTLVIQPWDKSALSVICKAIQTSDLGINPQNDGTVIRLNFPPLTEERRKQLTKEISKIAEDSKVAIRQLRRDAMDKVKAMKKNSEITEDDQKIGEDKVQKITDDFIKQIDEIEKSKTAEIMEI